MNVPPQLRHPHSRRFEFWMKRKVPKVLLLGDGMGGALGAVRSFGRKRIETHLAWHPRDWPAAWSRYAILESLPEPPNPAWIESLLLHVKDRSYDLVVPLTEKACLLLYESSNVLSKLSHVSLPKKTAFDMARNKIEIIRLASSLKLPVQETVSISTPDEAQWFIKGKNFRFPLLVKPMYSVVNTGMGLRELRVHMVDDLDELSQAMETLLPLTPVAVQNFFAGTGVGVEVLCKDGRVLFAFEHRRVHEPLRGGASSYRVSEPLDPRLYAATVGLMNELSWTGVAMVEFRVARDSPAFVLLEVNPRFWGSLPLAISAGADFPYYLYRLLVEGETNFPQTYRLGTYNRFLAEDIPWLLSDVVSARTPAHLNTLPLSAVMAEIKNIASGRERWDSLTLDDPAPFMAEILLLARRIHDKTRILPRRALYDLPGLKQYYLQRLRSILPHATRIVFVCYGNLCRSPFAEIYLENRLKQSGLSGIKTASAGFHVENGRSPPIESVRAAQSFGVDIAVHKSRSLSRIGWQKGDIVFVFDPRGAAALSTEPRVAGLPIFPIGILGSGMRIKIIHDPWGRSKEIMKETYEQIANLIESLNRMLV